MGEGLLVMAPLHIGLERDVPECMKCTARSGTGPSICTASETLTHDTEEVWRQQEHAAWDRMPQWRNNGTIGRCESPCSIEAMGDSIRHCDQEQCYRTCALQSPHTYASRCAAGNMLVPCRRTDEMCSFPPAQPWRHQLLWSSPSCT